MKHLKFFIFGILAAMGALVSELILSSLASILLNTDLEKDYSDKATLFLIVVVFIEEFFKLILLAKIFSQKKYSSKLTLGLLFGSGFAFIEIYSKSIAVPVFDTASFLGVFLIHMITAGMITLLVIRKPASLLSATTALIFASCLHFFYNLLVIHDISIMLKYTYLFLALSFLFILKIGLQNKNDSTIIRTE